MHDDTCTSKMSRYEQWDRMKQVPTPYFDRSIDSRPVPCHALHSDQGLGISEPPWRAVEAAGGSPGVHRPAAEGRFSVGGGHVRATAAVFQVTPGQFA